MTELLELAIERVRELPAAVQDELAAALISLVNLADPPEPLDEPTRLAVAEGLAQAERGEFASEDDVKATWKRFGL